VVKVDHEHLHSLALLANKVGHRNLDVLQLDERRAVRAVKLRLHLAHRNPGRFAVDEQSRQPRRTFAAGAHARGEEVRLVEMGVGSAPRMKSSHT